MDEIKDIQQRDPLSTFLDNSAVRTKPFGRNTAGERAYQRAEKIAAAVHLLTRHIPEKEPVRSALRSNVLDLLGCVLALRDELRVPSSSAFNRTLATIRTCISGVRILCVGGFVSEQNAAAVVDALDELGHFLSVSQRSLFSESVVLTKEQLLVTVSDTQGRIKDIRDAVIVKDKRERHGPSVKTDSNGRSDSILQVLKSHGEMGIKDITVNLPEYSEKMIQRELLSLIVLGRVKKTGAKRWSRYSLANQ